MDRPTHPLVVFLVVVTLVAAGPGLVGAVDTVHLQDDLECTFPYTVEDGTGTNVSVDEPPEDIVVLHANAAQIAQDIGVWERVTGAPVTPFTAYLDDHDDPTDVTDDEGFPDREEIVNLSPDLVIAGHVGDTELIETLRDNDLTVYMGPPATDVPGIGDEIERYGKLTDACDGAEDTLEWMSERLESVEEMTDGMDRPLVYYELGDGYTTGSGTFQHDLIQRAGGENLGSTVGIDGWAPINTEEVVAMDPDWIVHDDSVDEPPVADAVEGTTAISSNQTVAVDANYMGQAGPRVVLALETMATQFAESQEEDDVVDADIDDTAPNDADGETDETNGDDALVGFGIVIGGAAVVFATILRHRR